MEGKKHLEKQSNKEIREFLLKLPEGRKIFYRLGNLMVEVTREEALKLLKKEEERK